MLQNAQRILCKNRSRVIAPKAYFGYTAFMVTVPIDILDQKKIIIPDALTVFTLAQGTIDGAYINATNMIQQAQAQFALNPAETLILGHGCLCAALFIARMGEHNRVSLRYETDGLARGFSVEASQEGFVRGYLLSEVVPVEPLLTADVSALIGTGVLTVTHFFKSGKEPLVSTVQAQHHSIAQDLAEYFLRSEGLHTNINSSIQLDTKGRVVGAGALYVQSSGAADDQALERTHRAFSAAPSLGQWIHEGGTRDDLIFGLFRGLDISIQQEHRIAFFCPCSEERFFKNLSCLPQSELQELYTNGADSIELYCHNCGSSYVYPREQLAPLVVKKHG